MSWTSTTWLGVLGGGFSGSVVLGGSAYQCNLWRLDGHRVPMMVMITGFRIGLVAQIEAGHMVCLLQGVSKPSDFDKIKSSGIDWTVGTGVDWDSLIKSGSKLAKTAVNYAGKTVDNWAANETVKKGVQALMGDYELKPKGKSFMMLPTPAALSAGIGIFYEWQTMSHVGTSQAYNYVPPKWSLSGSSTSLKLMMKGIPEPEGKRLALAFYNETWGQNELLHFDARHDAQARNSNNVLWITVKSGKAYYNGEEGIPLGRLHIVGHTEGTWVTMPKPSQADYKNKNLSLRFQIATSRNPSITKWKSSDTVSCGTTSQARIHTTTDYSWKD